MFQISRRLLVKNCNTHTHTHIHTPSYVLERGVSIKKKNSQQKTCSIVSWSFGNKTNDKKYSALLVGCLGKVWGMWKQIPGKAKQRRWLHKVGWVSHDFDLSKVKCFGFDSRLQKLKQSLWFKAPWQINQMPSWGRSRTREATCSGPSPPKCQSRPTLSCAGSSYRWSTRSWGMDTPM